MQAKIVKTTVHPKVHSVASPLSFHTEVPEGAFIAGLDLCDGQLGLVVMGDFSAGMETRYFSILAGSNNVWLNDDSMYVGSVTVVDYGNFYGGPNLVTMADGGNIQGVGRHTHDFNVPEIVTRTFHVIEVT